MNQVQNHDSGHAIITQLVKRCASLCQNADAAIAKLPAERESFLANSLGDALRQLELVLRVLGDAQGTSNKEERQGFLRRLFARTETGEAREFSPPKFDISQQGLQGNSMTVSLGELLSFLAFGHKTGVLWVDAPDENFLIGLVAGRVMHATSDRTPEGLRLGEVLVRLGYLTRRQLERFIEQRKEDGAAISGEILLKNGMISEQELHEALKFQVQQLVTRVVNVTPAIFRFREGMEVLLACKVDLDINQLLLESARTQDEANDSGLRKNVQIDNWNSWQNELSSELSSLGGAPGGSAPAAASPVTNAAPVKGGEKPAEAKKDSKPGEPEAGAKQDKGPAETPPKKK